MKHETTKRFPRTLQDAFGPYTSDQIDEPKRSLFGGLSQWAAEVLKPDTQESYQQDAINEAKARRNE